VYKHQRIKDAFFNRGRAAYSSGHRKVLDLSSNKKPKVLADYQAYQKLYKYTKINAEVDARWPAAWEKLATVKVGIPVPQPPIWFRNKVAKELLAKESDEVKAEIEKYRKENVDDSEVRLASEEIGDNDVEKERLDKAHAYQLYVLWSRSLRCSLTSPSEHSTGSIRLPLLS
jgi:hypothetical protein